MGPLDSSLAGSIEAPDMETLEQLQRLLLDTFASLRRDGLRASEPVWKDSQEARQQALGVAELLEFTASAGSEVMAEVLGEYLSRELGRRFPTEAATVQTEDSAVTVQVLGSKLAIRSSAPDAGVGRTYS
ncbi:MAG: hypothetical protein M3020_03595 [Myxococcota bacterium]|jgi:hypothetical protein|nr:hypothetical protein [Myxococcota bacterium]